MGLLGGIMKSVVNPMSLAQLAMGPAGWASLAMQAATSAIAQQAIQIVGKELGLPQGAINLAQQAAAGGAGQTNFGSNPITNMLSQFSGGMTPTQQGQMSRLLNNEAQDLASSVRQQLNRSLLESNEDSQSAKSGGKGSIFMQIAVALGKIADKKMKEMASLATEIGNIDAEDKSKANETTQKTGEMQAKGQEFGLLSNAMSNAIKSLGEGMTQLARKG